MDNLIGSDYENEVIPEDDSKENNFLRFFKIIKRKFWAMIKVNLMQVVCSLPAFAVAAFGFSYMYVNLMSGDVEYDLALRLFIGFMLVSIQVIAIGPLQAGFIYVIRNYVREEHAFIWSDFIKGVKENWKRALLVSTIDFIVVFIVSYAYLFYGMKADEIGIMSDVFKTIIIIIGLIYAMMHMYIYPMMVTLDLTVKQVYSNALRFAVAKFLPNLIILAVMITCSFLLFVNVLLGLFIILLIGYSFMGFLSTFYAYGAIEKYIIQKIKA